MAGGNLLRKAAPSLDSKEDCGVISTRRRNSGGRESPEDEQGHAAMTVSRVRRNGVAPYMASTFYCVIDAMKQAQETARLSGAAGTAAASVV